VFAGATEGLRHSACASSYANPLVRARAYVIGIVAAALAASPCYAQVMEISPDGVVSVRDGSGPAHWRVVDDSSPTSAAIRVPSTAITESDQASVPARYADAVNAAADSAGISPALLSALVWKESRWDAAAISPKGAVGLTQLMPGTARELGVNPNDPVANLTGGARYLRQLLDRFGGDIEKALAAYNAGPDRVIAANGIPPIRETQAYVASIVQRVSSISSRGE
jgi:soluble lytic murein transglycosylase-like protein